MSGHHTRCLISCLQNLLGQGPSSISRFRRQNGGRRNNYKHESGGPPSFLKLHDFIYLASYIYKYITYRCHFLFSFYQSLESLSLNKLYGFIMDFSNTESEKKKNKDTMLDL